MSVKFLHTRIRVSDLERSIDWYGKTCGYRVHRRNDKSPAGNRIVHLELPGNPHMLELCHSPDYQVVVPEDLMHTCIGVEDVVAWCERVAALGIEIWPADWRTRFAAGGMQMAFVTDPDGYELEVLPSRHELAAP
jgi:lactoylglutathione lyase